MRHYWLFKTEPTTYALEDLQQQGRTMWEGVRNYQARNFLKQCKNGDLLLFYHSNCVIPGIYGLAKVVREAYPDPTQFDRNSKYYDARATTEQPRWVAADIAFVERFKTPIMLNQLQKNHSLQTMMVVQKGNRLSITPVAAAEWKEVLKMK